jgi:hypothetical protein
LATDLSKVFIEFIAFNSNIKPIKIKLTQMGQNRYYADAVDSESDTDQKRLFICKLILIYSNIFKKKL